MLKMLIITKSDWQDHSDYLNIVFQRLNDANLQVKAKKFFFGEHELEYLGYWITRSGIRPVTKKVEAINNIALPTTT